MRAKALSRANGGTKDRIIEASRRLFSEHGLDAVPLRDIAAEAEVNGAAINYHFGTKDHLIREIYRQLFDELNRSRIKALDAYEAQLDGKKPAAEKIIRAWIASTVAFSNSEENGGIYWVRLLFHAYGVSREFVDRSIGEQIDHITTRFVDALHTALPHASREDLFWRFDFAIGACLHILIDKRRGHRLNRISAGLCDTEDSDRMIDQLVASITASLTAPKLRKSTPVKKPIKSSGPRVISRSTRAVAAR